MGTMAMEQEKQEAARRSLTFVKDGYVVGLGTGSSASYAIRFLGERVREGLNILGIPTSVKSRDLAAGLGADVVASMQQGAGSGVMALPAPSFAGDLAGLSAGGFAGGGGGGVTVQSLQVTLNGVEGDPEKVAAAARKGAMQGLGDALDQLATEAA